MNYNFTINETSIKQKPKLSELLGCPYMTAQQQAKAKKERVDVQLFRSSKDLPLFWDETTPKQHLFLKKAYLDVLEHAPPKGMRFAYLVFSKQEKNVGLAICQVLHFNAEESINTPAKNPQKNVFEAISRSMKSLVARKVDFNGLVCGNLLLTGEHGFYFDEKLIGKKEAMEALASGIEKTREIFGKEGVDISVTYVKEYFETSREFVKPVLEQQGYFEFQIQPNMMLKIPSEWATFEDYLGAMSSKYRVKTKRALKKGKAVVRKELDLQGIRKNKETLYALYRGVADGSGFNTFLLHPNYFYELKRNLGDAFCLIGYYVEEEMVAFFTTIDTGEEMEANFLGYNPAKNKEFQIYHNILLDLVKQGIHLQASHIVFARTALEIKSSIGAVPHEMYNYIKHRKSLPNKFIKKVFEYLNTPEEWKQRHPFKA